MAFRSVVNHHLGQQEAHYRLTIQVTETLFCKCYSSNFLCERLAAVPAFLGGHSSQRMLLFLRKRKEPVVIGCVG